MSPRPPTAAAFEALRVAVGATTAGLTAPGGGMALLREYVEGLQRDMGTVSADAHLRVGLMSLVTILLVTLEADHGVDSAELLSSIAIRFGGAL